MNAFVDTHAHLAMLEHTSAEEAVRRAKSEGVHKIITVSTNETSWEPNRRLAEADPDLYYTLGIHPHEAHNWTEGAGKLFEAFTPFPKVPDKCVAIGEMGLDFYYDFCPKEVQINAFENQLTFAQQVGLPVVIHCRDAFAQLYASMDKVGLGERSGVLHCFTGTRKEAFEALDRGLKISFSGILTFRSAQDLRDTAAALPLSELFLETDCPYLAPLPHRGKPNEPGLLPLTALCLATTLGKPVHEIAEATSRNAVDFFRLH